MSLITTTEDGVRVVTLNRPEVHNAFDDAVIAALTAAYAEAIADPAVGAILLKAEGKSFCAGGDLNWMRRMASYSHEENLDDAGKLAALMRTIDLSPKPTLVRVHASAFAGATGLIAASDIVVAVPEAEFAVTEVKIGLIPAVISPYLSRPWGRGSRGAISSPPSASPPPPLWRSAWCTRWCRPTNSTPPSPAISRP